VISGKAGPSRLLTQSLGMAGIESHDDLATHPKTRRAARALGISIPTMVGHLHLLWHWCLKYADDGDLSGYDSADIADAMMWEGDPDELVEALVNCGPGDRFGFLEHAAHEYYSIVNQAIKTHDPNHLYVGSRIHGRTIVEPVFRGAGDVDVVSINYYHRWSAETERLAHWVEWSGRPFLDSEWYAMELPDPKLEVQGAGFRVRTQRDRGLFYQNMVLGLLGEPGCVGWHWFKYGGDSDTRSVGFVDRQYQPHAEMTKVMQAVNRQVYPLADFLSRKGQE